jgi:hypothetical protein
VLPVVEFPTSEKTCCRIVAHFNQNFRELIACPLFQATDHTVQLASLTVSGITIHVSETTVCTASLSCENQTIGRGRKWEPNDPEKTVAPVSWIGDRTGNGSSGKRVKHEHLTRLRERVSALMTNFLNRTSTVWQINRPGHPECLRQVDLFIPPPAATQRPR